MTLLDDLKHFYAEVDWFLKWLTNICPETMPYIAQKWLRSDPPNLRTEIEKAIRRGAQT